RPSGKVTRITKTSPRLSRSIAPSGEIGSAKRYSPAFSRVFRPLFQSAARDFSRVARPALQAGGEKVNGVSIDPRRNEPGADGARAQTRRDVHELFVRRVSPKGPLDSQIDPRRSGTNAKRDQQDQSRECLLHARCASR